MAGVAGASIQAPGPYDKTEIRIQCWKFVSWDKDRAESYLREYNWYILQILISKHSDIILNSSMQNQSSLIKSLLGSSSMVGMGSVYRAYDVEKATATEPECG